MMKKRLLLTLLAVSAGTVFAQNRPQNSADSSRRAAIPGAFPGITAQRGQPRPFKQVITEKALSRKGMFNVHKVDDKYYFEIPDSMLGREMLVVSRISKAGAEVRAASGYAGDQIGSTVIRFEKGPSNKIFMRKISYRTYSPDSTRSMYQAVQRSNIQAIAAAFTIQAFSDDKSASVIDITDYANGDNEVFFFGSPQVKSGFRLGNLQTDRSYIDNIRTFSRNIELTTVKTYALTAAPASGSTPAGGVSGSNTLELNTSIVLLPEVPMQARYFDPRVGFFTVGYTDFDLNPQGIKDIQLIKRWRLEPKPQDMAKYKRGELVEPKKPIIFYIDPATPKKWVPYLIAGVNDWQKAFEKAGFKKAIIGKIAPTAKEDSTWSLDDATHSAIVYKPSEIANANGPSIADPRSGEIMESHINWFHNVQKLVHDWYFIQTAAIDPRAQKMEFSDELMGELIRFVSSHEVGHTLGLRHNYGSSSTVPVENLRNKSWVEANGHTPSIMDYARFNYVAQPEDHISPGGIYPRIGEYDKWAIEWGYRVLPDVKSPQAEVPVLNKITVERLKDRRLFFGTETNPDDPHSQSEDLSDNAMKAGEYGIRNLQRILARLPEWTRTPNEGYGDLKNMYNQLVSQFNRYMGHVAKNIGGIYETPKTVEQAGVVYERVPAATQKEAFAFLDKNLFTTPSWLLDRQILDNTGINALQLIGRSQETILNRLVGNAVLAKLVAAEAADGQTAYTVTDLFTGLHDAIFRELKVNASVDVYRRNLQKIYVEQVIELLKPPAAPASAGSQARSAPAAPPPIPDDVRSVAKAQLRALNEMIKPAIPAASDTLTRYHLQDLSDRIAGALDPEG
jgi:hypothetical protein